MKCDDVAPVAFLNMCEMCARLEAKGKCLDGDITENSVNTPVDRTGDQLLYHDLHKQNSSNASPLREKKV